MEEQPPHTPVDDLLASADMQDHMMVACNDLERLQGLLAGACDTLLASFDGANQALRTLDDSALAPSPALTDIARHLATAITALQFQDMASQLVAHTTQRLRNCCDRLAAQAWAEDDEPVIEPLPLRPNPVTQDEMDAGSIELF